MEIKERVIEACKAISDKKGLNIKIFDIGGISSLADYFIIATAQNRNQNQAMSDEVYEKLAAAGYHPNHIEGYDTGTWILLDYGDFMVHLFEKEARDYYNLERIWKDAKEEEYKD